MTIVTDVRNEIGETNIDVSHHVRVGALIDGHSCSSVWYVYSDASVDDTEIVNGAGDLGSDVDETRALGCSY